MVTNFWVAMNLGPAKMVGKKRKTIDVYYFPENDCTLGTTR